MTQKNFQTLQVGEAYRTNKGKVVTMLRLYGETGHLLGDNGLHYLPDGTRCGLPPRDHDLIEQVEVTTKGLTFDTTPEAQPETEEATEPQPLLPFDTGAHKLYIALGITKERAEELECLYKAAGKAFEEEGNKSDFLERVAGMAKTAAEAFLLGVIAGDTLAAYYAKIERSDRNKVNPDKATKKAAKRLQKKLRKAGINAEISVEKPNAGDGSGFASAREFLDSLAAHREKMMQRELPEVDDQDCQYFAYPMRRRLEEHITNPFAPVMNAPDDDVHQMD